MLACDRPGNIVCEYMWRRLHLQECNINVALTSPSQTGCIRCIAYRFRWLLYVAMMWVWFFFKKKKTYYAESMPSTPVHTEFWSWVTSFSPNASTGKKNCAWTSSLFYILNTEFYIQNNTCYTLIKIGL